MKLCLMATAVTACWFAGISEPARGQGEVQSFVDVSSKGETDRVSHELGIPQVFYEDSVFWATPATVEIVGFILKDLPNAYIDKRIPDNKQDKYVVSFSGGSTSVAGKSDRQRIDENSAGILASAIGKWRTETSPPSADGRIYLFTTMYTAARINAIDPPPFIAVASADVYDPFPFPAIPPDESLLLESTLYAGQTMQALGEGVGVARVFVGTDLPGYETLYELNVEAREESGTPALSVDFSSHPQLGLDDNLIKSTVFDAFHFDDVEQRYELVSDVTLFNGSLPLPSGQSFNLYLDEGASGQIGDPIEVTPPSSTKVILSPTAIVGTDLGTFSPDTSVENMIDGSGLDKSFVSGVTLFDNYIDENNLPLSDANYVNYFQDQGALDGQIMGSIDFDLGDTYDIDRVVIWNHTVENASLLVADAPDGPWQEVGQFTLENRTPTIYALVEPTILDIDDTEGRYLRVEVESVYPFLSGEEFAYAIIGEIAVSVSSVLSGVPGDYNEDGVVNAADYVVWRNNVGMMDVNIPNDPTPGSVTQEDYAFWVDNFGTTGVAGSELTAVPEPVTLLLVGLGFVFWWLNHTQRIGRRRPEQAALDGIQD